MKKVVNRTSLLRMKAMANKGLNAKEISMRLNIFPEVIEKFLKNHKVEVLKISTATKSPAAAAKKKKDAAKKKKEKEVIVEVEETEEVDEVAAALNLANEEE